MKLDIKNFDLKNTVTCGQIFRYEEEIDGSYTIILSDRVINIKQKNNILYIDSNNMNNIKNVVIDYFDLDRDYEKINNKIISYSEEFIDIINLSTGFKMIHQSPFETIIEYIISANNSVPSIRNSLNLIANKYGKKVEFKNKEYYLFPNSSDLKDVTVEEFRTFKVGFRDKYLYNIVQKINNKEIDLNLINSMNTTDSLELLMNNTGIGPKVASCILLFAYQKFDVFPIDTWVKKYMLENYNIKGEKNIRDYILNTYHEYSGIVIQYIFNYNRNIIVKK